MGKNCSDCLPCKQGLPCGGSKGVHGMVGMQGYGGVRRITNWGGSYGLSTEGETQIDAWMAADSEDWPKLITLIEETYLAEPGISDQGTYDQLVINGEVLSEENISKITYLNYAESLLAASNSTAALLVVTKVLTHYRKRAIMMGGGAMLAGIVLSGSVSMTPNKVDDWGHIISVAAMGWGGYTLAKAYGLI